MWRACLAFALLLLAAPPLGQAQPTGKVPRIGVLTSGTLETRETQELLDALRGGLRERGYVEGRNLHIEYRGAGGQVERFPQLAAELVALKVDVIVAGTTPGARAAMKATSRIPIVSPTLGDPVGDGLVASLARPDGNLTGSTFLGPELTAKRLELLKEAMPGITRVAALWQPGAFGERTTKEMLDGTEAAARALGVQLKLFAVDRAPDFEGAFLAMKNERAEAVIVLPGTLFFAERRRLMALAEKHRLPTMSNAREFAEIGGLMAYGANIQDLHRRSAVYVDRILKGAKPAELPIEQPTHFELVVNLKTAKALGIKIPQSVLLRADRVIE